MTKVSTKTSTAKDGDFALDTKLLRVEAVAHELQIGRTRAFALIKSGAIESVKIGGSRRVPRECLDAYVQMLRAAG